MKLNTKEENLRRTLGLLIPYTAEELKILSKIEVKYQSVAYHIVVRIA